MVSHNHYFSDYIFILMCVLFKMLKKVITNMIQIIEVLRFYIEEI